MAVPDPAKSSSSLPDEVKKSIQSAYSILMEEFGFTPRYGQRQMIAEIANCLAGIQEAEAETENPAPPICVVEAGTGTGKTLAYVLAVLPLAKQLDRKVVLATATVALQEQVILKDLPDILRGSGLQFSFSMAKGRGRYLCLARLDSLLQSNASLDAMFDLYGDQPDESASDNRSLYQAMLDEVSAGRWQGDRDDWQEPVADSAWRPVTVDNSQCMGARCSYFKQCCFFKAREQLDKVDCIVSNHALVLAALALGGGVILPDPAQTIFIFDEAHHLPVKSNNHFSAFTRIKGSIQWLQQADRALQQLAGETQLANALENSPDLAKVRAEIGEASGQLGEVLLLLEQLSDSLDSLDSYGNSQQHTFTLGVVPGSLRRAAEGLEVRFAQLHSLLMELQDDMKQLIEDGADLQVRLLAEQWFPLVGGLFARAESSLKLWTSFAHIDAEAIAPSARWLTITEYNDDHDISLASSPVLAADNLADRLWRTCSGAVLTSATLSALGKFDVLKMRTGLPEQTRYLSIPSPFDFPRNAVLSIPRMNCDPSDTQRHTDLIVAALPQLLEEDLAALLLFSSRRQMQDVLQGLDSEWHERVLCQDDYQKSQLLKLHRERIDKGERSIICGLASFAEGIDLPGKYCTHVLIAKIPFTVPNDPIEATLSQWIEARGDNPFMTLAVPEAAFRLVQACGRLLRNEKDQGRVTIFDERLVTRFYGKTILDSLPPYRREIFQRQLSENGVSDNPAGG
ncbi:MAG: ATP-dependent DNA helicase DinG [Gammaproteobacteria bacterium]|nr:ATP-dependent DNA helicase DinG [Gammaproteobacteria bacterium]